MADDDDDHVNDGALVVKLSQVLLSPCSRRMALRTSSTTMSKPRTTGGARR